MGCYVGFYQSNIPFLYCLVNDVDMHVAFRCPENPLTTVFITKKSGSADISGCFRLLFRLYFLPLFHETRTTPSCHPS